MQENRDLMELMEKMAGDNEAQNQYLRKQLFFTRIFAIACCVLVAAFMVVLLKLVPPVLQTMEMAVTAMDQATETLKQASETMEMVDDALVNIRSLFEEDGLVGQSSAALTQATEKISQMDIEELNRAIGDLGAVVEPLANFFEKFR
ncbi:MAG: hypothetical protein IJ390_14480 [Lachnospiraceae bacterium]|nr:hypothetical protein [Lachnospiraceae bacterium]